MHTLASTTPPQSNLGRAHHYPHVGECTLPLRVLAVQCATLWNCYGTLLKHHGSITEHYGMLRIVTEALQNCCKAWWNVTEPLWNAAKLRGIMETLRKHYEAVTGHYGSVTEMLYVVMGCYGMLQRVAEHCRYGNAAYHYIRQVNGVNWRILCDALFCPSFCAHAEAMGKEARLGPLRVRRLR